MDLTTVTLIKAVIKWPAQNRVLIAILIIVLLLFTFCYYTIIVNTRAAQNRVLKLPVFER